MLLHIGTGIVIYSHTCHAELQAADHLAIGMASRGVHDHSRFQEPVEGGKTGYIH